MGNVMYCAGRIMSHPSPVSKQQESDRINTNVSEDGFNSFPFPLGQGLEHPSCRREAWQLMPGQLQATRSAKGSTPSSAVHPHTRAKSQGEQPHPRSSGSTARPASQDLLIQTPRTIVQLPRVSTQSFEMVQGTRDLHVGHSPAWLLLRRLLPTQTGCYLSSELPMTCKRVQLLPPPAHITPQNIPRDSGTITPLLEGPG